MSVPVGLVGAGPWARFVHAPALAGGPETVLAGIWARRPEAAAELAAAHGTRTFASYEELLDHCEAVAFAVPPDVQAELAPVAARAGKHLLLEKPLAADVAGAARVAEAVGEAGVRSLLMLTYRFRPPVAAFLDEVRGLDPFAARAWFISGGFLSGPFTTPWRLDRGAVLDLGPHVLDLVEAALGPIVAVRAVGEPRTYTTIQAEHAGGAVSDTVVTGVVPGDSRTGMEVFGPAGWRSLDCRSTELDHDAIRRRFAAVVAGAPEELDADRGLRLQRVLADIEAALVH